MKFLTVQQPKVAERDILDHLQRALWPAGQPEAAGGRARRTALHMI